MCFFMENGRPKNSAPDTRKKQGTAAPPGQHEQIVCYACRVQLDIMEKDNQKNREPFQEIQGQVAVILF